MIKCKYCNKKFNLPWQVAQHTRLAHKLRIKRARENKAAKPEKQIEIEQEYKSIPEIVEALKNTCNPLAEQAANTIIELQVNKEFANTEAKSPVNYCPNCGHDIKQYE